MKGGKVGAAASAGSPPFFLRLSLSARTLQRPDGHGERARPRPAAGPRTRQEWKTGMNNAVPQSLERSPLGVQAVDLNATDGVLALLSDVFRRFGPIDFAIRLWDGRVWGPGPGQPARFTLEVRHPAAIRRLFVNPDRFSLGEAYLQELFEVEGDLAAALRVAEQIMDRAPGFADRVRYTLQTWRFLSARPPAPPPGFGDTDAYGSLLRTRRAVNFHYDLPLEFWQQWLDRELVYSCAYFSQGDETLDEAQERKLDTVCRRLRLQPGERLLDLGCGWGALVRYAARHYGVHATGITLSARQADYANARIREEGLEGRCRVEVADFRQWNDDEYDKIAGISVIEHIPQAFQHQYFDRLRDLLRPGGLFLNQGITCSATLPSRGGSDFMDRYVFPDAQLVPVSTSLRIAESVGWEVREVENLREHFALTLEAWRARLEENAGTVRRLVGESVYRTFRGWLCAAAADLRTGGLNCHDCLLALTVEEEEISPFAPAKQGELNGHRTE